MDWPSPKTQRRTLTAIASGKGGTGKTFFATNLAQALSYEGERVLLFDADLGLANVVVHLGIAEAARFGQVLAGECAAHDAAAPVNGGAAKRGGFDVLAGPAGSGHFAEQDVGAVLRTVAALRLAVGYDRVLLDLAAGIDAPTMRFATAADETLLVLTPDPASLTDAYAFAKLYSKRTVGHGLRYAVNMAANATEAQATADLLANACRNFLKWTPDYLGFVRRDSKAGETVRRQKTLLAVSPKSPAAADLTALAGRLAQVRAGKDTLAPAAIR